MWNEECLFQEGWSRLVAPSGFWERKGSWLSLIETPFMSSFPLFKMTLKRKRASVNIRYICPCILGKDAKKDDPKVSFPLPQVCAWYSTMWPETEILIGTSDWLRPWVWMNLWPHMKYHANALGHMHALDIPAHVLKKAKRNHLHLEGHLSR